MIGLTLDALAASPRWVAWRNENVSCGITKIPYSAVGSKARANEPATWRTRAEAKAVARQIINGIGGGIGIELGELPGGSHLAGIDLDTCRAIDGTIAPWAGEVVNRFASYTEISPSGTGIKQFFTITSADVEILCAATGLQHGKQWKRGKGEHPPAIELHISNRFFAVTGQHVAESPREITMVSLDTLLWLVKQAGPAFVSAGSSARSHTAGRDRSSSDRSRSAAAFRKGAALRRAGKSFEEMVEALLADPETSDWVREKGERDKQRELRRIWEKAGAEQSEPGCPIIRVQAGKLAMLTTEAELALIESGLPVFQRGRSLVRPIKQDVPASRGRMTVAAGLKELAVPGLLDLLAQAAAWKRYDARRKQEVETDPPAQLASILLSRAGEWHLPPIAGVITTPTLRPDGSILSTVGHDAVTQLYLVPDPDLRLPAIPERPTKDQATTAIELLDRLLDGFPFVSQDDRAVALSALLTPVVRGAMTVVPLHAFCATTAGTGKSYLTDLISAIASGRPCPVVAAGQKEEETEKRLAALLLAGFPLVSLDNVNGELGGDLLCQAIERPLVRIRPLGRSEIVEIESRTTIFATGNALRVRGDMTRRTLTGNLDAGVERPELRTFTFDPVDRVLSARGRYVAAALTVARAYITAGCPDTLSTLASFEDWSRVVRSALVWLGRADPVASMEAARENDPELIELRDVIALWQRHIGITDRNDGRDPLTARDLATQAESRKPTKIGEPTDLAMPDLRDALLRVAGERGEISTKRLGTWLGSRAGRIVGGLAIRRSGEGHGGITRWALCPRDSR